MRIFFLLLTPGEGLIARLYFRCFVGLYAVILWFYTFYTSKLNNLFYTLRYEYDTGEDGGKQITSEPSSKPAVLICLSSKIFKSVSSDPTSIS